MGSPSHKQPPTCILDSFNKFWEVLIDELPDALPFCKKVDHKIKVVFGVALMSRHFIGKTKRN
jgi:hypothetical protein